MRRGIVVFVALAVLAALLSDQGTLAISVGARYDFDGDMGGVGWENRKRTCIPMQFACAYCGATTDVADENPGQTCHCAHCGKTVDIPVVGSSPSKKGPKPRITCFMVVLIVLLGQTVIDLVVGLLLPSVQAMREEKRRENCVSNLRQIGLAMQGYRQKHGCFPPSFIPDKNGKPKHSWRVLILPFLEQEALYREYRFDESWDGPHNIALVWRMPSVYRCPSDPSSDPSHTSYAMIVGPHAISDGPTARRIGDIQDELSNTIMVAEAAMTGINWLEPRDLNTKNMSFRVNAVIGNVQRDACEISSCHSLVANVVFCDGSVATLSSQSLSAKELEAMTTIDGGEAVAAGR
jgi:prepilin-type processing-associated H-X9-DG protein